MKRVLVVDDEADMLWMLQRNLNKGMKDVEILAAESGEEALSILSDKKVNLVISDINMPGMNGLDLLLEINNRYPQTGVIIMTAYPSNTYENQAMLGGSLRFIEKPFDIKDVRQIVQDTLNAEEGFQGTVDGIDLMDIVQFNGLARATAALKVTTANNEGMIFFKNGAVVHAMCDSESGESAFFKLISFQGGSLQNIRGVEPPVMSIKKSLESLLMEAASRSDEHEEEGKSNETTEHGQIAEIDFDFLDSEETTVIAEPDFTEAVQTVSTAPEVVEDTTSIIEEGELEMTEIQEILAEFTNIEGVHTACLVGRDGFLLDSLARAGIDSEMIAAIASSGFGSAESMGNQLGQGELNMTMFEYDSGPVMFAPVGNEAFLVIVADKGTNLGWIRIAIKKNSKKIAAIAEL
ncbi:response regulator [Desulfopila aestuarii]|uniref:Roadblock/LC7 domain-containing protein n=1 Tax=Desulfopila aestuarii DSM 18488 TaxID=1121416 RepID=A0A1M7YJD8_9BACT|nr:response regulator [Desulfopila aestuarii]SHO52729.1 Roadblock/LC7 domain-containing protein [Desulfopila aestuarii DSM 18488]